MTPSDHPHPTAGFRFSQGMPGVFLQSEVARTGSGAPAAVDAYTGHVGAAPSGGAVGPTRARVVYLAAVAAVTWLICAMSASAWLR